MTTPTLKQIEFQGAIISAVEDGEGFSFQVETRDPWGNLRVVEESEDVFESEEQAVSAGVAYWRNYDPTPEEAPYPEDESFVDMAYRLMKLK